MGGGGGRIPVTFASDSLVHEKFGRADFFAPSTKHAHNILITMTMRFRRQSGGSYLIVIALLCILSMLYPSSKFVSQFQVRSIDNGHSKSKFPPKHGLAITMAVNYKAGPIGAKKVVRRA